MVRKIQRLTDDKFLVSFENDTWVDGMENGTLFSITESINIKKELLVNYDSSLIRVFTNYRFITQK